MGMFDAITEMGKGFANEKAARKSARGAERDREAAMQTYLSQNHQPELVSQHIGPYQRSRSPVADAFLESMLTGQNPAAVQGTRAGSAGQRAAAQRSFNTATGGFEDLRARQNRVQAATPWETTPFARDLTGDTKPSDVVRGSLADQKSDPRAQRTGLQSRFGIAPEDEETLSRYGIRLNPSTGVPMNPDGSPVRVGGIGVRDPGGSKRLAEALQAGDTALAHRILMGGG